MEYGRRKKKIGDILVSGGVITNDQLNRALEIRKQSTKKIGEILVDLGVTTETEIVKALSRQLGLEIVRPNLEKIPEDLLGIVNGGLLRKYTMVPVGYAEGNLNVVRLAMADPMDMDAIDDFSIVTNLQVEPCISTANEIMLAIDKYYGDSEALNAAEKYASERKARLADLENEQANSDIENSPIVILVKTMIEQAARQRASDIHIEALQNKVRVRYRIDGALYEKMSYDIQLLPAIIARIKVIGGMDISEKRKPQDGRITAIVDRKEYDIRVSVLPTVYGEKAVMRLALKTGLQRDKSELGLKPDEMAKFDHILSNPNGIILVTGPTGSGKSTTLYTALSELNTEDVNIITVEDPVEANIDGINQVQVNPKAELTFASALRSILRQDPDIIMIGEIRDAETAQIAVQASITGHLVVSTLHTNSSAATVTRLVDMGLESYLVADSVVGIIAQRLVRKLCPHCKRKRLATLDEKKLILAPNLDEDIEIYEPVGCYQCAETGYFGRIGVYEIMEITPALKRIIAKEEGTEAIKQQALKEGMSTLRMSAAEYVREGITGITEMLRVSYEE
ncbi:MAG: ATPase, T2SS/T4P/T4SS family [Oscillospiraceae bacterium]|nr:ATPase, T2SS/T4P/T4SS family [Oscillospiraceae bacterium]